MLRQLSIKISSTSFIQDMNDEISESRILKDSGLSLAFIGKVTTDKIIKFNCRSHCDCPPLMMCCVVLPFIEFLSS